MTPRGWIRHAVAIGAAFLSVAALAAGCTARGASPIRVGAVYPLEGSQGPGGAEEYRGVRLAAQFVDEAGGVDGRPIELRPVDVPSADAAEGGVAMLHAAGYRFVVGSYGSTISIPAAEAAAARGMLYWETGAVALADDDAAPASDEPMTTERSGSVRVAPANRLIFHVPPTGSVLGRAAIDFMVDEYAARLQRPASELRFAVANVDDAYGSSVADGAIDALRARGLRVVGRFAYPARGADMPALARRIEAARPDILFVSAYVEDGVRMRRALVRAHVPLVAGIGSSSSYCMPAFGAALGKDAVGLFASDKPDAGALNPNGLLPAARSLLLRASAAYRARYGGDMPAAALSGFSAGWALFHDVMPSAASLTPAGVAVAARAADLPRGSLPNGSGLRFADPGAADAGSNLAAASVIWEWVGVDQRAVVWPPEFATQPPRWIPIAT
jgi:branched-chain amino acid transport system substrate-binding protein